MFHRVVLRLFVDPIVGCWRYYDYLWSSVRCVVYCYSSFDVERLFLFCTYCTLYYLCVWTTWSWRQQKGFR